MELDAVARHWASRIHIEFADCESLMTVAADLLAGRYYAVYQDHKHLLEKSITNVPGRPIQLYFLQEIALDLKRFYE